MSDRMGSAADRFADWLDADGSQRAGDDLTDFADRVMREAALPQAPSAKPSREQRERIRAQVFGEVTVSQKARNPVNTQTFGMNGTTPTAPSPQPQQGIEHARASGLSILMAAAVVALIGIAAFGLVRGSLDFTPGGSDSDPAFAPGIAMSPAATPDGVATCDRGGWVDIFTGTVPDIDAIDTAILLEEDGTLTLECDGRSEVLATGVRDTSTMLWPGVIAMVTEHDGVRLLNITSGTTLDLDGEHLLDEDGALDLVGAFYRSGTIEPWLITPVDDDHTDWRIIDLRSMESFLLSDELGKPLPRASEPAFGQITGTDVAVVIWRPNDIYLPATPFVGGRQFPSDQRALVLPGSLEDRRWIDIAEYREQTAMRGSGFSQTFSVSPDTSLLAYTTVTDDGPVIRIEETVDGTRVADVPIDTLERDTRFMLAGNEPHLITSDGDVLRIYRLEEGDVHTVSERQGSDTWWLFPTSDPDTVLISHNAGGTSVTPLDVKSGEVQEPYRYVPPILIQIFGGYEIPQNIVRITSDSAGDRPATIQLVNPSTGDVVLESDPINVHPNQVVSFNTYLRDGGSLAVVPIGYNRAIVMDADAGVVWEVGAPVDDDRLWRFYPSMDGETIGAIPEPPTGTTEYMDAHITLSKPGAEWVPIEQGSTDSGMVGLGTPAPDSP